MSGNLGLVAVVIVLGTLAADRLLRWSRPVRKNLWLLGLWFGAMAILATVIRGEIREVHFSISLRNVPVIAAGFFFDPVVGLTAGAVAAIGRLLLRLASETWLNSLCNGGASLLVALCAVAMRKWLFGNERPLPIMAAASSAVAACFYLMLSCGIMLWFGKASDMLTLLYASYPDVIYWCAGIIGTAAVLVLPRERWKTWKRGATSIFLWGLLLYCTAFGIVEYAAEIRAARLTDDMLEDARQELETRVTDQIHYMMHRSAVALADYLGTSRAIPMDEMRKFADQSDVDEINVFAADGTLLATNLEEVRANNRQHPVDPANAGPLAPFFALTEGRSEFVRQASRDSRSNAARHLFYVGVPMPDGKAFLELGYSRERLAEDFEKYIYPMFSKANIGRTGYFILTDEQGKILISDARHAKAEKQPIRQHGLTQEEWNAPPGVFFDIQLFGDRGRSVYWNVCGIPTLRAYAVLPYEEHFLAVVQLSIIVGLLLFGIMILFRWVLLQNFRKQAKIDLMRAEEMEIAARIQNSELKRTPLDAGRCRCCAFMKPAKEVGGDFFDYYELPGRRIAVAVADVSGKGVAAAFFMMKAKEVLQQCLGAGNDLAGVMEAANRELNRNNSAFMFVTAWVGICSADTGLLEYVSAGHNPALVRRADGTVERLCPEKRQKPLAAFPGTVYRVSEARLAPGDRLFLYTDGVTEAMNAGGELFGEERLAGALARASADLHRDVMTDLRQFVRDAPQADDITMLTLEVKS